MPPKPAIKRGPKNATRKTKEERDNLEAQEAERRRSRQAQAEADAKAEEARRRQYLGLNDSNPRGRGDKGKGRQPPARAFGDGRSARGGFMRSSLSGIGGTSRSGFSAGRGGSSSDWKRETTVKPEPGDDTSMLGAGPVGDARFANDTYRVDSDEEDGSGRRRIDVQSELMQDAQIYEVDSDDGDDYVPRASARAKTPLRLPIRVGRNEHKDRTMGINTEASTAATQDIKRQAEIAGEATGARHRKSSKGPPAGELVFKGVYQDDADADVAAVKPEPGAAPSTEAPAPGEQQPAKPKEPRRKSLRRRARTPPPQTEEERQEREITQFDKLSIINEFGTRIVERSNEDTGETYEEDEAETTRNAGMYLFQLPPVMPELLNPDEKVKSEAPGPAESEDRKGGSKAGAEEETIVKQEDDGGKKKGQAALRSGHVGKLRVHKSGKVTLSWGGTSMQLGMGVDAYFLQSVVMAELPQQQQQQQAGNAAAAAAAAAPRAMSFGQIRGKFVVTPDWEEMLK